VLVPKTELQQGRETSPHQTVDGESELRPIADFRMVEKMAAQATIYERKLAALDDLKKSLLHQAFSGNL